MSGPSPNEHWPTEHSRADDPVEAVESVPASTAAVDGTAESTAAFDVAPELVAGSDGSA